MKQKISLIAIIGWLAISISNASADVYIGGTSNIFPNALINNPWFEINSVQVTNDSANLYFKLNLAGYPASWGS